MNNSGGLVGRSLLRREDPRLLIGEGQFIADQPMSFMLTTAGGSRIFCGGDTSLSVDMQTWKELCAPHVAVLGIGGLQVGPVKIVELPPSDAAIATEWLGVSHVLPVHYPPGDPAPDHLRHELAQRGSTTDVVTLEFGDTWTDPCRGGRDAPGPAATYVRNA